MSDQVNRAQVVRAQGAIGLIETRGLIGVLEAADTAAKAADVQLLGVERIGGGLVSVRFRGDTASVQAAVQAASEAVRRVSELVSAHVIPSPAIDVETVLGQPEDAPLRPSQARRAPAAAPESVPQSVPQSSSGSQGPSLATADLQALPVTRLRQLARKTPGVALQGREISRANKGQLIDALRAAGGHASGHD